MSDQAAALRGLIERQQTQVVKRSPVASRAACTLAITSGKGGVGKSNIALNLGIALAQQDVSVCLLDANLGLGNLDLLCGLNGYWNLSHVMTGARSLNDVILNGPSNIHLISGASGLSDVADCLESTQRELLAQMEELEQTHQFLIIDTGTGIHRPIRNFVEASDLVYIVTTPEPTAIADAYATIKALSRRDELRLQLIVNQAESSRQAKGIFTRLQQTTSIFLRSDVEFAGYIPHDSTVIRSVVQRQPFLLEYPDSPASRNLRQLASRLKGLNCQASRQEPYFSRLWNRFAREAA